MSLTFRHTAVFLWFRSGADYSSFLPAFPSARSDSNDVLYGVALIISCLVFAHDKHCHFFISCFSRYSLLASSPKRVSSMAYHRIPLSRWPGKFGFISTFVFLEPHRLCWTFSLCC